MHDLMNGFMPETFLHCPEVGNGLFGGGILTPETKFAYRLNVSEKKITVV